jgi:hypothetical protein
MHTYDFVDVLPRAAGGGPRGSFIRLIGTACGKSSFHFRGTHVCDLATGVWSRYALCDYSGPAGGSAYDPKRNRFYLLVASASAPIERVRQLDTQSRSWDSLRTANSVTLSVESTAAFYPPDDLLLYVQTFGASGPAVWALPLGPSALPRWVRLAVEGQGPLRKDGSSRGIGLEFCPIDRCLYCVPGGRDSGLWKLTPARAGALKETWRWSREPLNGRLDIDFGGFAYKRLRWSRALDSFVWVDGVRGSVQLIRPASAAGFRSDARD